MLAGCVLWDLQAARDKERNRMTLARSKLPFVVAAHTEHERVSGGVVSVLGATLAIGGMLAVLINLSRIPPYRGCIIAVRRERQAGTRRAGPNRCCSG
jgi:hypothetical protein